MEEEILYYPELNITRWYGHKDYETGMPKEEKVTIDWEYRVDKNQIIEFLYDLVPDSIPEDEIESYVLDNYEELLEKYKKEILNYFREYAEEDAQDNYKFEESLKGSKMKFKLLKEGWAEDSFTDTKWEEVASKAVKDSDGFWTDYTWYKGVDEDGEECHIFMFGDKDIYDPDRDYADWETGSYETAKEWFDNYNGFINEGLDDDFFNSRHNDSHLVDVDNKEKTIHIGNTPIKVWLSKFINKTSNALRGGSKVSQAGVSFNNNTVIIATTESDVDRLYNKIPDKFASIDEFIKYIKDFGYDKDDTSEVPNPFDKFIDAIKEKTETLHDWSREDEEAERATIDLQAYFDVRRDLINREDIEREVRKVSEEENCTDGSFSYGDNFIVEFDLNNIWVDDASKSKKYPTHLDHWEFELEESLKESLEDEDDWDYFIKKHPGAEKRFNREKYGRFFNREGELLDDQIDDWVAEVESDEEDQFGSDEEEIDDDFDIEISEDFRKSFTPDTSMVENFIQSNSSVISAQEPQSNNKSNQISSIADANIEHDDVCDWNI